MMHQLTCDTPLGPMTFCEDADAIISLSWETADDQNATPLLTRAATQLGEYFDGARTECDCDCGYKSCQAVNETDILPGEPGADDETEAAGKQQLPNVTGRIVQSKGAATAVDRVSRYDQGGRWCMLKRGAYTNDE